MKTALLSLLTIMIFLMSFNSVYCQTLSVDCANLGSMDSLYASVIDTIGTYEVAPKIIIARDSTDSAFYNIRPVIYYSGNWQMRQNDSRDKHALVPQKVTLYLKSDTITMEIDTTAITHSCDNNYGSCRIVHLPDKECCRITYEPNTVDLLIEYLWVDYATNAKGAGFHRYSLTPEEEDTSLPALQLLEYYSPPFSPTTGVAYRLNRPSNITITVWDLAGRFVDTLLSSYQDPGEYNVTWDMLDYSGNQSLVHRYFYKLETPEIVRIKKLVLGR